MNLENNPLGGCILGCVIGALLWAAGIGITLWLWGGMFS